MKATGNGTVTITAKATDGSGKSASCRVNATVLVENFEFAATHVTMYNNQYFNQSWSWWPANAKNPTLEWWSDAPGIFTVSNGTVYSAYSGSWGSNWAWAQTTDGTNIAKSFWVDVQYMNVSGASLNVTSLSMNTGDGYQLQGYVYPAEATDNNVSWSSSNESIATVSGGYVRAKKVGTCTITMRTADGGYTAACTVMVKGNSSGGSGGSNGGNSSGGGNNSGNSNNGGSNNGGNNVNSSGGGNGNNSGGGTNIPVNYIYLNKTDEAMLKGGKLSLAVTIGPNNATNRSVTWSSSDTKVATVDSNGNVTARGKGTAKIIVYTANKTHSASCKISVVDSPFEDMQRITDRERLQVLDELIKALKGYVPEIAGTRHSNVSINVGGAELYFREETTGILSLSNPYQEVKLRAQFDEHFNMLNSFTLSTGILQVGQSMENGTVKFSALKTTGNTTASLSVAYNPYLNKYDLECGLQTGMSIPPFAKGTVKTTIGISGIPIEPDKNQPQEEFNSQLTEAYIIDPQALLDSITKGISDVFQNPEWQEQIATTAVTIGVLITLMLIITAVSRVPAT